VEGKRRTSKRSMSTPPKSYSEVKSFRLFWLLYYIKKRNFLNESLSLFSFVTWNFLFF
jgi:hypothetical protein